MRHFSRLAVAVALFFGATAPAAAQRYTFERSFDTPAAATLDAVTNRGKITVTAGPENRVIVRGTVTVRVGLSVPLNANEIAQRLAANPPVQHSADRVQLRPPSEEVERRAVTIAYDVTVPVNSRVTAISDSGALSIAGIRGPVTARTQSGALALANLKGAAEITTGSGAVDLDGADGDVGVTTSSSAITARALRGDLRVKTGSGVVAAESRGSGDIDITTSSSAITVSGAAGGLRASTQSGRIEVAGRPTAPWSLSTGSSAVRVTFDSGSNALLDADTGSGSIRVSNLHVAGRQMKQQVKGAIGNGGPPVTITSRGPANEATGEGCHRQWRTARDDHVAKRVVRGPRPLAAGHGPRTRGQRVARNRPGRALPSQHTKRSRFNPNTVHTAACLYQRLDRVRTAARELHRSCRTSSPRVCTDDENRPSRTTM